MHLVARAKAVLLSPRTEWGIIDTEPASVPGLYTSYVIPLAAISPVAVFIGFTLIGTGPFHNSLFGGVRTMLTSYVLALIGVYVTALIIDALAPTFGGTKDLTQAFKVSAYSMTAAWLAGVFAIIPPLSFLAIVGLYSLYLLYVGLPLLMKTPAEKAMPYTFAVIIVAIVIWVVLGYITRVIAPMGY